MSRGEGRDALAHEAVEKHEPLSYAALARARVNPEVERYLDRQRACMDVARSQVRVLDWGCGRGESVLLLREQGYEAFGVDISESYLANARDVFRDLALDPDALLRRIEPGGKLPFPDESFDFAFSEQVLEHVADLPGLARELARVLRPGGAALHVLPPHRGVVEQHLQMPFVHWLPKGRWRRAAIAVFAACGLGPRHWLYGRGWRERVEAWSAYSDARTFYRPPSELRAAFEACGLCVRFVAQEHPRLRRSAWIARLLVAPGVGRLAEALLARHVLVELYLERPR